MQVRSRILPVAFFALALYGCSEGPDQLPTDVEVPDPLAAPLAELVTEVLDGANGGHPDFLWLPPVITDGDDAPGPLAEGLSPEVEVCNKNDSCERITAQERGKHYQANLKSAIEGHPRDGSPFTVRVYGVGDYLLGSFQVALTNNRNVPIRFWIGEGFDDEAAQACLDETRCNLGAVLSDDGGTVRVTNSGPEGTEIIAAARFPMGWSPGGIDRAVIIDCRNDLPSELADDGTGPLNSALTQLPWFCDFSLDPPLADGEEFLETVIVEICETLDVGHGEVVLGKSSGDDDFELLPFVQPTELDDCFTDYPGGSEVVGDASGFWGKASNAVAAVLRVLGPERLNAMLRDGGAGGAVRSFSSINPVIPAQIHVEVVGDGGGLEVTLYRGEDEFIETATTGEGGTLHFMTGLVEGLYTVAITGETEVEYEGGLSQSVEVDGSGPFDVEFVPVESETSGTITSTIPAAGWAGFGQLITILGEDLPTYEYEYESEPEVWFTQGESSWPAQFVWSADSDRWVVRSPVTGTALGPVDITIISDDGSTNVHPYEFISPPAAPVITNPVASATVIVGNEILVEAHGIDTNSSRFVVEVVQGETVLDVTGSSVTGGPNGLPANRVTLPLESPLDEGPAIIRVRVGNGSTIPFGPYGEVSVELVIPG